MVMIGGIDKGFTEIAEADNRLFTLCITRFSISLSSVNKHDNNVI